MYSVLPCLSRENVTRCQPDCNLDSSAVELVTYTGKELEWEELRP